MLYLYLPSIWYWIILLLRSLTVFFNFVLTGKSLESDNSRRCLCCSACDLKCGMAMPCSPGVPGSSWAPLVTEPITVGTGHSLGQVPPHSLLFSPAQSVHRGRGLPAAMGMGEKGSDSLTVLTPCPGRSGMPFKHSCGISLYYFSHMVYFILDSSHLTIFKDSMEI